MKATVVMKPWRKQNTVASSQKLSDSRKKRRSILRLCKSGSANTSSNMMKSFFVQVPVFLLKTRNDLKRASLGASGPASMEE